MVPEVLDDFCRFMCRPGVPEIPAVLEKCKIRPSVLKPRKPLLCLCFFRVGFCNGAGGAWRFLYHGFKNFMRNNSPFFEITLGWKPQPTVISNKKQILQHLASPGFCLDFAPQKQVVHFTSLPFTIVFATSGLRSLRSHPPYAKSLSRERRSGESVHCSTETIDVHKTWEN